MDRHKQPRGTRAATRATRAHEPHEPDPSRALPRPTSLGTRETTPAQQPGGSCSRRNAPWACSEAQVLRARSSPEGLVPGGNRGCSRGSRPPATRSDASGIRACQAGQQQEKQQAYPAHPGSLKASFLEPFLGALLRAGTFCTQTPFRGWHELSPPARVFFRCVSLCRRGQGSFPNRTSVLQNPEHVEPRADTLGMMLIGNLHPQHMTSGRQLVLEHHRPGQVKSGAPRGKRLDFLGRPAIA
jgi:hypothetical protein